MFDKADRNWMAGLMLAAGLAFLASPWLLGFSGATAPTTSVSVVAVLLAVLGLMAAGDRTQWAAAGAMAVGAWSLVAPIVLALQDVAAFWTHMTAGIVAFLAAIAASEAADRRPPHNSV